MRLLRAAVLLALPTSLLAQTERISLDGSEVAIYNLVGRLQVNGGSGDKVVIEVTRVGRDAGRLELQQGSIRGRMALRVIYPGDRIHYSDMRWNGRTNFTIADDGTWGDHSRGEGRYERRRIEVSSRDGGLDAHANLRVTVPKGKTLHLRQGIGETTIENIDGNIFVDVAAAHTRISGIRGNLSVDAGSGGVDITDVTGNLTLDSGSGGATVDGVRGTKVVIEVGSGSLRGRSIEASEIIAEVGSGGVKLLAVKTPLLHVETGSGGSEIELLTAPEEVSIEAGSGGITLRMPATTSASVDVETGSGSIDTDFEVKLSRIERRALRGTIGTGKGRIRIESGSGSVRLLKI